ncbi:hypothetical protein SLITO_v1c10540 [Spiroplasma litorale]|uniref:DUF4064 domain-containing protein n=1 Tax=Spiroplasma litorale TaxID=216942 RepID=A0A0K1W2W3_9MOLU|nr:hypothetical protein [Spiroplasma litorale]AKX34665.1 hypothetical protein SLITO_v1c10540 [Spiroplasma litorale]
MNKLAKGGIITSLVGAGVCFIIGLVGLIVGLNDNRLVFSIGESMVILIGTLLMIGPIIFIILASLSLIKKTNRYRLTCGIVSTIFTILGGFAFFIPSTLFLVGGILTLCGETTTKKDN